MKYKILLALLITLKSINIYTENKIESAESTKIDSKKLLDFKNKINESFFNSNKINEKLLVSESNTMKINSEKYFDYFSTRIKNLLSDLNYNKIFNFDYFNNEFENNPIYSDEEIIEIKKLFLNFIISEKENESYLLNNENYKERVSIFFKDIYLKIKEKNIDKKLELIKNLTSEFFINFKNFNSQEEINFIAEKQKEIENKKQEIENIKKNIEDNSSENSSISNKKITPENEIKDIEDLLKNNEKKQKDNLNELSNILNKEFDIYFEIINKIKNTKFIKENYGNLINDSNLIEFANKIKNILDKKDSNKFNEFYNLFYNYFGIIETSTYLTCPNNNPINKDCKSTELFDIVRKNDLYELYLNLIGINKNTIKGKRLIYKFEKDNLNKNEDIIFNDNSIYKINENNFDGSIFIQDFYIFKEKIINSYNDFSEGSKVALFINSIPGSGKSSLLKYVKSKINEKEEEKYFHLTSSEMYIMSYFMKSELENESKIKYLNELNKDKFDSNFINENIINTDFLNNFNNILSAIRKIAFDKNNNITDHGFNFFKYNKSNIYEIINQILININSEELKAKIKNDIEKLFKKEENKDNIKEIFITLHNTNIEIHNFINIKTGLKGKIETFKKENNKENKYSNLLDLYLNIIVSCNMAKDKINDNNLKSSESSSSEFEKLESFLLNEINSILNGNKPKKLYLLCDEFQQLLTNDTIPNFENIKKNINFSNNSSSMGLEEAVVLKKIESENDSNIELKEKENIIKESLNDIVKKFYDGDNSLGTLKIIFITNFSNVEEKIDKDNKQRSHFMKLNNGLDLKNFTNIFKNLFFNESKDNKFFSNNNNKDALIKIFDHLNDNNNLKKLFISFSDNDKEENIDKILNLFLMRLNKDLINKTLNLFEILLKEKDYLNNNIEKLSNDFINILTVNNILNISAENSGTEYKINDNISKKRKEIDDLFNNKKTSPNDDVIKKTKNLISEIFKNNKK